MTDVKVEGVKGSYPSNKYGPSFSGETRSIQNVDVAAIPPTKPRPLETKETRFSRGQPTNSPA